MNLGRCKACEVLREQNKYLQGIIDRLLIKNGVTPLTPPEPEEPEIEDTREKYGE
jgi:hypothetical protein